ncbi:hypothetical protein FB451DRAFT_1373540 [Mycena latifolia]|nr:hypothetical protein FB451DRAFT_1373540 [Mycena latifolia]
MSEDTLTHEFVKIALAGHGLAEAPLDAKHIRATINAPLTVNGSPAKSTLRHFAFEKTPSVTDLERSSEALSGRLELADRDRPASATTGPARASTSRHPSWHWDSDSPTENDIDPQTHCRNITGMPQIDTLNSLKTNSALTSIIEHRTQPRPTSLSRQLPPSSEPGLRTGEKKQHHTACQPQTDYESQERLRSSPVFLNHRISGEINTTQSTLPSRLLNVMRIYPHWRHMRAALSVLESESRQFLVRSKELPRAFMTDVPDIGEAGDVAIFEKKIELEGGSRPREAVILLMPRQKAVAIHKLEGLSKIEEREKISGCKMKNEGLDLAGGSSQKGYESDYCSVEVICGSAETLFTENIHPFHFLMWPHKEVVSRSDAAAAGDAHPVSPRQPLRRDAPNGEGRTRCAEDLAPETLASIICTAGRVRARVARGVQRRGERPTTGSILLSAVLQRHGTGAGRRDLAVHQPPEHAPRIDDARDEPRGYPPQGVRGCVTEVGASRTASVLAQLRRVEVPQWRRRSARGAPRSRVRFANTTTARWRAASRRRELLGISTDNAKEGGHARVYVLRKVVRAGTLSTLIGREDTSRRERRYTADSFARGPCGKRSRPTPRQRALRSQMERARGPPEEYKPRARRSEMSHEPEHTAERRARTWLERHRVTVKGMVASLHFTLRASSARAHHLREGWSAAACASRIREADAAHIKARRGKGGHARTSRASPWRSSLTRAPRPRRLARGLGDTPTQSARRRIIRAAVGCTSCLRGGGATRHLREVSRTVVRVARDVDSQREVGYLPVSTDNRRWREGHVRILGAGIAHCEVGLPLLLLLLPLLPPVWCPPARLSRGGGRRGGFLRIDLSEIGIVTVDYDGNGDDGPNEGEFSGMEVVYEGDGVCLPIPSRTNTGIAWHTSIGS